MKEGLTSVRITPRAWPFYVDPLKFLLIIELMPQNTKSQIAPASYNFLQSHCYISFGRASKHLWSFICLLLLKSLTSVKYVKFTSSNWLIEDNIQILLINVSFPFDPNKAHMNVSEISQFVISYFSEIYWRYVRKLATQIVRIRVILFRRPRSFTDSSNDKRGCVLKIKVQRVIPEVWKKLKLKSSD